MLEYRVDLRVLTIPRGTMVALTYISMIMAWPRRAQIPL